MVFICSLKVWHHTRLDLEHTSHIAGTATCLMGCKTLPEQTQIYLFTAKHTTHISFILFIEVLKMNGRNLAA